MIVVAAGAFLVVSALLQTLSPMVTKQLLLFITDSYTYSLLSPEEVQASGLQPPGTVSRGIGLAFALFAMQEAASLFREIILVPHVLGWILNYRVFPQRISTCSAACRWACSVRWISYEAATSNS